MKIVAMSDGHGTLPDIPSCDVFIHAGDICPATNHTKAFQSNWLETFFAPWLQKIDAKHKIIIAGNHDWIFYNGKGLLPELDCIYLEDSEVIIDGIKFWGSPWSPWFFDWAFNFRELGNGGEGHAERTWAQIPDDTDVLITHGPAKGHCDMASYVGRASKRVGCPYLLDRIEEVKPKVHIFGHIHMADFPIAERVSSIDNKDGTGITFHNVSVLNERYRYVGQPSIIEI